MNTKSKSNPTESYETIKLGIDAHAKWYYVARQLDGATPQPVQKMTFEGAVALRGQTAGPRRRSPHLLRGRGFRLPPAPQTRGDGGEQLVVQPQDWDERGKGVKKDRIDALALCQRLDRFMRGNRKAFSVVRVPTEEEERERASSRQRGQLVRERQRLQAMGRSSLAIHGIHVTGKWWKGKTWTMIQREAPGWVMERLEVFIRLIEPMEAEEKKMTEAIQEVGRRAQDPEGRRAAEF